MWLIARKSTHQKLERSLCRGFASRTPKNDKGDTTSATPGLNKELMKYMHGRGNRERRDSVTNHILRERELHLLRLRHFPVDAEVVKSLKKEGLGHRRRKHQVYSTCKHTVSGEVQTGLGKPSLRKTNSGAGGFATYITSATQNCKHLLPEIAFAGHSNSGKVIHLQINVDANYVAG